MTFDCYLDVSITQGGDIYLNAPNIRLTDGGSVISRTIGSGTAGDIEVTATSQLELIGASELDVPPVLSNISNIAFPVGKTGVININAPTILITDGATITNIVAGNSKGADIIVNADNIRVSGTDNVSGLSASSISSSSSGLSEGANIYINATDVQIEQGAIIATFSFDTGRLGNVNINASNSIKVDGFASQTKNPSSVLSTVLSADEGSREIFAQVNIDLSDSAVGNSGNLNIQTAKLDISNNATISVLNQGIGDAGNLQINAEQIFVDNAAQISASTLSGEGGNITINSDNTELLNLSQITANAGGTGNGGNININSNTILGIQNSDISANAISGDGGNITIDSDFIVGLQKRSLPTPLNDITATSEFGIDGTITINAPDNNLREQVYAAFKSYTQPRNRELLERRCLNPRNLEGKILNIGRAGIPANPDNFFDDDEIVAVERVRQDKSGDVEDEFLVWQPGDPIVNSNAVKLGTDGEIYLVAETRMKDVEADICEAE